MIYLTLSWYCQEGRLLRPEVKKVQKVSLAYAVGSSENRKRIEMGPEQTSDGSAPPYGPHPGSSNIHTQRQYEPATVRSAETQRK